MPREPGRKGKKGGGADTPVETEIIVRSAQPFGARPAASPLSMPAPVSHCFRCLRKDILVIAVLEGRLVGLCPDHFTLDVMTYVP